MEYVVLKFEFGGLANDTVLEEIARFNHNDISSNSFLRSWTQPAWHHYFKYAKEHKLETISDPAFNEDVIFDNVDNFCAPLTLIVRSQSDNTFKLIRYIVLEASSL